MDALELRNQLIQSLLTGLDVLTAERAVTTNGFLYIELTGRIDEARLLLNVLKAIHGPFDDPGEPDDGNGPDEGDVR